MHLGEAARLTPEGFLLTAAMPEELQGLFERSALPVIYTGLGKVNASYHLMRALSQLREAGTPPRAVVNFGTAGSSVFKTHELVEITSFVQRDMDVSPLGFAKGTTPFDKILPVLRVAKRLVKLPTGACGTGDSFEIAHPDTPFASYDEDRQESFFGEATSSLLIPAYDVVDMEAYALAKICLLEDLDFFCVKYISDGADPTASRDWTANLPRAAARFLEIYPELATVYS